MTTRSDEPTDDRFWRRPDGPDAPPGPPAPPRDDHSYAGPPPSAPPPPGWRPPVVMQPPPPRQLPAQDETAVEADEQSARTLTYGVGLVAGAVLLVVVCLLCSRVLF
ncbi:translation initiation factor 2 [Micromonospora sp. NPDC049679]|uniref:translation initiation factor 2 n=1 Tax=Micromonospora sp. NPDC049679 TaxID=3155920 RepID=UPI0033DEF9BC